MSNVQKKEKFFELLEQVYNNLEKFALNLSRNRDVAKDLVSETIIRAYDNFSKLRNEQAFLSYIFSICSNTYYSRLKRVKREQSYDNEQFDELYGTEISPERQLDYKFLYDAIDKLPKEMKDAIILFEIIGLPQKEIAEIQNITVQNLKVRLHRARHKLAELLEVNK